ncbi:ammonium transporter Rh type A, partial [Clarias magur]
MPAFSTNMRLKFPIVALLLEVVTIVLYAVFVVYDDDSGHHGPEKNANETNPVALYP